MKKSNLEIINLAKDADGYIVTIETTRTPYSEDIFDMTVERQSTHTNFTCYETAIDYFYQNTFRVEALLEMMEDGWSDVEEYSCEMRLIAFNINDMNADPSMEDYECATFNADYYKEVE